MHFPFTMFIKEWKLSLVQYMCWSRIHNETETNHKRNARARKTKLPLTLKHFLSCRQHHTPRVTIIITVWIRSTSLQILGGSSLVIFTRRARARGRVARCLPLSRVIRLILRARATAPEARSLLLNDRVWICKLVMNEWNELKKEKSKQNTHWAAHQNPYFGTYHVWFFEN